MGDSVIGWYKGDWRGCWQAVRRQFRKRRKRESAALRGVERVFSTTIIALAVLTDDNPLSS
jgi:hypothetical protein